MPHISRQGDVSRPAYVSKRDVKRSPKEKAAEEATRQKALDGICAKCQDKINWKFKYDKYKPLKTMAACSGCRGKKLPMNYRTLCTECADARGVCPGCCEHPDAAAARNSTQPPAEAEEEKSTEPKEAKPVKAAAKSIAAAGTRDTANKPVMLTADNVAKLVEALAVEGSDGRAAVAVEATQPRDQAAE